MQSSLFTEREQAKAWMERTQKELQQQSETWALERKAEFESMFKQEQADLTARTRDEQDTLRQQLQHADRRHADTANLRLETARKEMIEQFQQQQKDFQDECLSKNRSKMEEYRRDCDLSTQLALDTHREKIEMEVENSTPRWQRLFRNHRPTK